MNSLSKVLHVVGIDGSHRRSRRRQNVHMELSAQSVNLRNGQTRVREHAALLHDVRPVVLRAALLQVLNEQSTHVLDSLGHSSALALPLLEQDGVVQNGRHNTSTIDRRARPQSTSADLELLHDVLLLLGASSDDGGDSSTLSVQTKVLGEGKSEGDLVSILDELTERVSIVSNRSRAIAQVGSIEENDVVLLLAQLGDLVPLLVRRIHSGGVVSASVEQEARMIISLADVIHHSLEVQNGLLAVQVRVLASGHSSIAENGVLVRPGGVREVHLSRDVAVLQELGKKTERTRSRNSLSAGDHVLLLVVDLVTPSELGGSLIERRQTNQTGILVILSAAESLLSLSDTRKDVRLQLTQPNHSLPFHSHHGRLPLRE